LPYPCITQVSTQSHPVMDEIGLDWVGVGKVYYSQATHPLFFTFLRLHCIIVSIPSYSNGEHSTSESVRLHLSSDAKK
jgi:hypothetical protein